MVKKILKGCHTSASYCCAASKRIWKSSSGVQLVLLTMRAGLSARNLTLPPMPPSCSVHTVKLCSCPSSLALDCSASTLKSICKWAHHSLFGLYVAIHDSWILFVPQTRLHGKRKSGFICRSKTHLVQQLIQVVMGSSAGSAADRQRPEAQASIAGRVMTILIRNLL